MTDYLDLWLRAESDNDEALKLLLKLNNIVASFWNAFHDAKGFSAPLPQFFISDNQDGTWNLSYEDLPVFTINQERLLKCIDDKALEKTTSYLSSNSYWLSKPKDDQGLHGMFLFPAEIVMSLTSLEFDTGVNGDIPLLVKAWNDMIKDE